METAPIVFCKALMAERSKAVDSRPTLFGGAGSNPAQCKLIWFRSVTVITRAFELLLE